MRTSTKQVAAVIIIGASVQTAVADTALDGPAFEDMVEGKTLTFSAGQSPYGVEYYAPDQRVIWSFLDGTCQQGRWYEDTSETGPSICFIYETSDQTHCWRVFNEKGNLRAVSLDGPNTSVLYETEETEPLICDDLNS